MLPGKGKCKDEAWCEPDIQEGIGGHAGRMGTGFTHSPSSQLTRWWASSSTIGGGREGGGGVNRHPGGGGGSGGQVQQRNPASETHQPAVWAWTSPKASPPACRREGSLGCGAALSVG